MRKSKRKRLFDLSVCGSGVVLAGLGLTKSAAGQSVTGNLSTTGVSYGSNVPGTGALATQTINTGFGDSNDTNPVTSDPSDAGGSELDAAYGTVSNGYLYIFLSGNIENNGNLINIFIDDGRAGGQNTLAAPNGAGNMQNMNGSVFSPGFNATYAFEANDYHGTAYLDQFNLLSNGTASYVGSVGLTNGIGASQNIASTGIKLGLNNTNTAGVGGDGVGGAASSSAAQAVSTGLELGIPLSLLGNPTGNIEVLADINSGGDSYLSNQFLPGLPTGTTNLGGGGTYAGTSGGAFNFSTLANEYFTVTAPVSNGIWLPTGSGSWATASNWTNSAIPNAASATAAFSSATAASTVTLDGTRTVGTLTFDDSNSYTIAKGTSGTLTLDNGGSSAMAAVTDFAGSHTISAPVVLNSSATLTVASNGDTLTISGNISGAGGLVTSSLGINGRLGTVSQVLLSGTNTYLGTTEVLKGDLQLGSSTALPSGTALTLNASDSPEGSLDLNGFSTSVASITSITGSGGAGQIINESATAGTATFTYAGATGTPSTFNGPITDSSATGGSTTALTVASGSLTLGGTNTYAGNTTVTGGTLTLSAGGALGSTNYRVSSGGTFIVNGTLPVTANITTGGKVTLPTVATGAPNPIYLNDLTLSSGGQIAVSAPTDQPDRGVLYINGLTFGGSTGAWQGQLDLASNDMIVHGGSLANVISQLHQGFNNGTWTGTSGIVSSTAAALATSGTDVTALGVEVNDDGTGTGTALVASFDGQPVSDGDILVKYTYFGDADLSGAVTGSDYTLIDNGFNNNLTGWHNGDFNYDGVVNGNDYTLIDNAYNNQTLGSFSQTGSPANLIASSTEQIAGASAVAVPEPASVAGLVLGAASLLGRRRRRTNGASKAS